MRKSAKKRREKNGKGKDRDESGKKWEEIMKWVKGSVWWEEKGEKW